MIETQLAQIATAVPFSEKINAVTTRGGKSTRDPPHPNHAEKIARPQVDEEESPKHDDSEEPEEENPEDTCQCPIAGRDACTDLRLLHQGHHQQQATAAHNGGC